MNRLPTVLKLVIIVLILGALSGGYLYYHHKTPVPAHHKSVVAKTVVKPAPKPAKPYYVGDTQTDGPLVIKLDKTYTLTQTQVAMPINGPAGDILFGVQVTVTNNGNTPANEQVGYGFTVLSSVYTQLGSDTSTGKYILPDEDVEADASCFGGGVALIPPQETITSCVEFLVPSSVLVDTYFYDNLKWYL